MPYFWFYCFIRLFVFRIRMVLTAVIYKEGPGGTDERHI